MTPIPFRMEDQYAGLVEIRGVMRFDGEFLVLETEKAILGEFNKKQHIIKIEPSALASVHLKRGLIQDEVLLYPKTGALLDAMPGNHLGHVQLRVWRNRRSDVLALLEILS